MHTQAHQPDGDRCPSSIVRYPVWGGVAGHPQRPPDNGQRPQGGTPLLDRGLSCGKRSAWREGADRMQPETPVTPTATVMVNLGERSYPIDIGGGTLDRIGARLQALKLGRRIAVVTNPTVARYYREAVERSLKAAG